MTRDWWLAHSHLYKTMRLPRGVLHLGHLVFKATADVLFGPLHHEQSQDYAGRYSR